jgi:hypothetical protein
MQQLDGTADHLDHLAVARAHWMRLRGTGASVVLVAAAYDSVRAAEAAARASGASEQDLSTVFSSTAR